MLSFSLPSYESYGGTSVPASAQTTLCVERDPTLIVYSFDCSLTPRLLPRRTKPAQPPANSEAQEANTEQRRTSVALTRQIGAKQRMSAQGQKNSPAARCQLIHRPPLRRYRAGIDQAQTRPAEERTATQGRSRSSTWVVLRLNHYSQRRRKRKRG